MVLRGGVMADKRPFTITSKGFEDVSLSHCTHYIRSGFAFAGLSVRVTDGFVGNAGTIRVNDGLGSSFTKLLDSFFGGQGILDTRINSFDSAISRLQSQISRVNERASLLEDRLRKQFTNLEVTLGRLNATGDYLTAQLKALPGVKKD